MSTTSPRSPSWQIFIPFNAYKVITSRVKVPVLLAFIGLAMVGGLLSGIKALVIGWPFINNLNQNIRELVQQTYPDELILIMENGELSTNVPEPYFIEFPSMITSFLDEEEMAKNNIKHLAVIDTQASLSDFEQYQTFVLLMKDGAILHQTNDAEQRFETYESDANYVLDKEVITAWIDHVLRTIPVQLIARALLVFTPFLLVFSQITYTFFTILFMTLYVWILMKSLSQRHDFNKLFVFTFASSALLILIFRLSTHILNTEQIAWARTLTHILSLGVAYTGLMIAGKKVERVDTTPEQLLSVFFYPLLAAKELIGSKRETWKKTVLGLLLVVFIIWPWIKFLVSTVLP
jgi:hypothetical protein